MSTSLRLLSLLFVGVSLSACGPADAVVDESPELPPELAMAEGEVVSDAQEWEFFQKLNAERTSRGRAALRMQTGLRQISREWSANMANQNRLFHRTDLVAQVEGRVTRNWLGIAENVGTGGSVASIHSAFMASSGHQANILGDYNYVGIGSELRDGKIWVTASFLKSGDSLATVSPPVAGGVNWQVLPGAALDIGVGGNGAAWVIGKNAVPGGYGIYRWNGSSWGQVPGGASRVAADGSGNAWVVNSGGGIYRWNGSGFARLPGLARDVAVGANGTAWVIGTGATPGGFGIHRWNGSDWVHVPGGAVRIAVDPAGNAWVINDAGSIYRWGGTGWVRLPGAARDIGIGANGAVWVLGWNAVVGGYGVYRWNGGGWEPQNGAATNISVGPDGKPWVVNASGNIFRAQ